MKFALLIHDNETFHQLSDEETGKVMLAHQAFSEALEKAGAIVGGEPLGPSKDAVTLFSDGRVQDGPFADSKEQLGGFYIIDVASKEEALQWAKKLPHATDAGGAIEVREVPSYPE